MTLDDRHAQHIVGVTVREGNHRRSRIALLSGGVGGARLARGLAQVDEVELTIVVNVGDDEEVYGQYVSPDLDTVLYTLAGVEGPEGWGVAGDTFAVLERLGSLGVDTTFRIGDRDLAVHLFRTHHLNQGRPLSTITEQLAKAFGVDPAVLPASDDPVRTMILTAGGRWRSFQDYFVTGGHQDEVRDLRFEGAEKAAPAPGVLEAIRAADAVVVAPSNPPLSIWPMLAIPEIGRTVEAAERVIGVSPLFGGKALKGPADRVLASLGYPPGNLGVVEAYDGLLHDLVIDTGDAAEEQELAQAGVRVHVTDTRIADLVSAGRFGAWLTGLL